MNLPRTKFFLAATVLGFLLLFLLLNVFSFLTLLYFDKVNALDQSSINSYFTRNLAQVTERKGSIPHPFFGMIDFDHQVFPSEISSEPVFFAVDPVADANQVKVLIVGGSVAAHMSDDSLFARRLNSFFGTNKFAVFNAAFGGGKQPSQYFKILYLDLLGFLPDIIVNIDGFNEIAVSLNDNFSRELPAIFPRNYSGHLNTASDPIRECWINVSKYAEKHSMLPISLLWEAIRIRYCRTTTDNYAYKPAWWTRHFRNEDLESYIRRMVNVWRSSSQKIFKFAESRGIEYIHVLQPNQYFPGSKRLSDEETNKLLSLPAYGEHIKNYYKLLSGEQLMTKNFYDQRMIFKDIAETLYNDNCCHFNTKGNELLIDDIIKHFEPVFREQLRRAESAAELQKQPSGGLPLKTDPR